MSKVINFENSEETPLTEETKGILNGIKNEIIEGGMVSASTIVTLENYMGNDSIPAGIKNSVTSVPSRHGAKSLIDLLSKIACVENKHDIKSILLAAADLSDKVDIDNLDKIEESVLQDIELVDKLYVPKRLRTSDTDDVMSGVRVGMFVNNDDMHKEYSDVTSRVLRYLYRFEHTHVPFGRFNAIMMLVDPTHNQLLTINRHYPHTIKDFMLDQLESGKAYKKMHDALSSAYGISNPVEYIIRNRLEAYNKEYIKGGVTDSYPDLNMSTISVVLLNDTYLSTGCAR